LFWPCRRDARREPKGRKATAAESFGRFGLFIRLARAFGSKTGKELKQKISVLFSLVNNNGGKDSAQLTSGLFDEFIIGVRSSYYWAPIGGGDVKGQEDETR